MSEGTAPAAARPMFSARAVGLLWAAVILWACFIFFMSAHTGVDFDEGHGLVAAVKRWLESVLTPLVGSEVDVASSLGHFCEYTVFGALLCGALAGTFSRQGAFSLRWTAIAFAVAVALASLYGVTDEIHQIFVPGRFCDPADWLVDTAGAALGSGLAALGLRSWFKSSRARLR